MSPLIMFNSTILVFWVTYFLPLFMRNENKLLLWGSCVFMLGMEIWLCLNWAEREFPFNLLAAFAIFLIGLMGGRVMHLFYLKYYKEHL